eukprot:6198078-Pleurochrysis_carterae.AAC.1
MTESTHASTTFTIVPVTTNKGGAIFEAKPSKFQQRQCKLYTMMCANETQTCGGQAEHQPTTLCRKRGPSRETDTP